MHMTCIIAIFFIILPPEINKIYTKPYDSLFQDSI